MLPTVMHNWAWHQEYMFVAIVGLEFGARERSSYIGIVLRDPYLDYAGAISGDDAGVAEGPITDPTKPSLAALKRGVASVKRGEPYLIDVITQPR